ncbi:PKD domain-containing protein [Winogradskyella aurantia]|uniref:PKD domain-containing protein n=1 Tax=Winogradskyella aurantia TaxID=1915063 RepID=A0A265UPN4_9FLAO|nr:PKD domain-containing protein [Winogradskyella aurantia]OZV67219.1 hypothetical protein CA834_12950 [Winogradskyella aurantia]
MKKFGYIICLSVLTLLAACSEDERDIDFINDAPAPSDVSVLFISTADNSGSVSMIPTGTGASFFDIYFTGSTTQPERVSPGEVIQTIYEEGVYTVRTIATGVNGKQTEVEQTLDVSFIPPQNLEVTVVNDGSVSNTVRVNATAEFGINYEVDFGEEDGDGDVVGANIGEEIVYEYDAPGLYTITVTAFSAAIETTEVVFEDFEVTEILAPIASAPIPPARSEGDVIGIFSEAYPYDENNDFTPFWGQPNEGYSADIFDLDGDLMLQYTNLSYQGIQLAVPTDVSQMETLHVDVWTPNDIDAKISPISPGPNEAAFDLDLNPGEWTSFDIPLSFFTDANPLVDLTQIIQFKFDGVPSGEGTIFVDNLYFYRPPTGPPPMAGTWRMSADEGFFVGEGSAVYFACNSSDGCSTTRACYFDDLYVFGADGSFINDLGAESWIEGWQGGSEACGTPVPPHDGSNPATYTYDPENSQVTLNGVGAYIGLPKVINGAEISNPADAPQSITYNVTLTDNNNRMVVEIFINATVFWQYVLERVSEPSPVEGTWVMSPNEGFFVGEGSAVYFACNSSDGCATTRACYFDDLYIFNADGSFTNDLGAESWIEGWQGGSEACGPPVPPHDGSNPATYAYDANAGTLTLDGVGAYIGLPKVINGAEISNPADAPQNITYNVELTDNNTRMVVDIFINATVFWQYVLQKI